MSKYESYYEQLFYELLPSIYREKDLEISKENDSDNELPLKDFFKIISREASKIHQNIDQLWSDSFIDTCQPWAVAYHGDLVGTNLLSNEGARNRIDVKKTINWRSRKGTKPGINEIANFLTGWNAITVEFFKNLLWNQNLNSQKPRYLQTPILSDLLSLEQLDTAYDVYNHFVDVTLPNLSAGWHNIKNIGFFFSRIQTYPISFSAPLNIQNNVFTFNPHGYKVPIFSSDNKREISLLEFSERPYNYYGQTSGFTVKVDNINAANTNLIVTKSTTNIHQTLPALEFQNLSHVEGISIVEPRKFTNPNVFFTITVFGWKLDGTTSSLTELGSIQTPTPNTVTTFNSVSESDTDVGHTLVKITLTPNSTPGVFPSTIIAIKKELVGSHPSPQYFENFDADDIQSSRFKNFLYVSLPETFLSTNDELYLLIDKSGNTFFVNNTDSKKGPPDDSNLDPASNTFYNPNSDNLARSSLSQIFPSTILTNTRYPQKFLHLNQVSGIKLPDKSRLPPGTIISAYFIMGTKRLKLGQLITPDTYTGFANHLTDDFLEKGMFVLSVEPPAGFEDKIIPMSEIVITDKSNTSILAYLPQFYKKDTLGKENYSWNLDFDSWDDGDFSNNIKYVIIGNDGSTYTISPENIPSETDKNPIISTRLARKSAGQTIPMNSFLPIRFRIPVGKHMHSDNTNNHLLFGELHVNPQKGIFCFPNDDDIDADSVLADFHYGFPDSVGAGTYDRELSHFSELPIDEPLLSPTRWISRTGDIGDPIALSKQASGEHVIFKSLSQLLSDIPPSEILDDEVIQIEDNGLITYDSVLDFTTFCHSAKNLTLQAKNGTKPTLVFQSSPHSAIKIGSLEKFRLNGIEIFSDDAYALEFANTVNEIHIVSSTINPVGNAIHYNNPEYSRLFVLSSILGKTQTEFSNWDVFVVKSIIDSKDNAISISDTSLQQSILSIERSTIFGSIPYVDKLDASESIFHRPFVIINKQESCIRYSRYHPDSQLSRPFMCTTVTPIFNSKRFFDPCYMQLNIQSDQKLIAGSENKSEMGVYYYGFYNLINDNFKIKLREYLPMMLRSASILEA